MPNFNIELSFFQKIENTKELNARCVSSSQSVSLNLICHPTSLAVHISRGSSKTTFTVFTSLKKKTQIHESEGILLDRGGVWGVYPRLFLQTLKY